MVDVGFTHVALPASDLEASIAFYGKYAAMQVVHRRENVVWLSDRTRPFVIVLLQVPRVEVQLRPLAHLGVACTSREEVDRLADEARSEGRLRTEPSDAGPPVGYWAFIADPDEHTLEIAYGQEVGLTIDDGGKPEF